MIHFPWVVFGLVSSWPLLPDGEGCWAAKGGQQEMPPAPRGQKRGPWRDRVRCCPPTVGASRSQRNLFCSEPAWKEEVVKRPQSFPQGPWTSHGGRGGGEPPTQELGACQLGCCRKGPAACGAVREVAAGSPSPLPLRAVSHHWLRCAD